LKFYKYLMDFVHKNRINNNFLRSFFLTYAVGRIDEIEKGIHLKYPVV
jgi:hypothetical protein